MSGQNRILNAEISRPKTPKGKALKSALGSVFSPSKIASVKGDETQPCDKKGK